MGKGLINQINFSLLQQVELFNSRFLIIGVCAVSFGLATRAFEFQNKISGLYFSEALSALLFWILEAQRKQH